MKNINNSIKYGVMVICLSLSILFTSCDDNDDLVTAPEIESISLAANDSVVMGGMRQNMYILRGSGFSSLQKIYFNDYDTYYNPTLVTDEVIFVTIDANTPYDQPSEMLRLVTSTAELEYEFDILQPAPGITSFSPKTGDVGTQVTIVGTVFVNLESVYFGENQATIISNTDTEIVVEAPAVSAPSPIIITTAGGTTESEKLFGGLLFKLYDEQLNPDWWIGGWGVTNDFANTENVLTGEVSLKVEINAWSGFQIGNGGAPVLAADYNTLQFEIYPENDGNIMVVSNGDFDNGYLVSVTGGEWQTVSIPVADLSLAGLESLDSVILQEFNGTGNVYYIDDFGLL
ncbi:IPT/TIG domain-containing protein [Zunongwangia endophytica]|uniref:IPT/TIG domain-containing protein n=1 Tax=Zunongwangia endophytica TaxID=1808945 RepID=A0ABV8H9C9_9FLAO|nr:IPT/TIG domain-containing protein [Zunongwangia endophytica]MDN3595123.1 IPT/TIG domain-containing protein [Zunongwangia endophytica]